MGNSLEWQMDHYVVAVMDMRRAAMQVVQMVD